jgi:parallel beta-helix repeat protein
MSHIKAGKLFLNRYLRSRWQKLLAASDKGTKHWPSPHQVDWPLFARIDQAAANPAWRGAARCPLSQAVLRADLPVRKLDEASAEAVRNALAELATAGGGCLYLPGERIVFEQTLDIPAHVHLIGQLGSELVFRTAAFGLRIQGSPDALTYGVVVKNLILRHEGSHCFSAAVFVSNAHDIVFQAVEIYAPLAVGFLLSDQVYRARLERCAVYHAGLAGFMLVRDVSDCVFDGCIAERCQQSGIFLTDLKLPPNVAPLDFDSQIHHTINIIGNFAPFAADDPAPQRNTLMNCTFARNRKMGITTDGTGNLRVINCIIAENDCEGITLDNGTWHSEIRGCHIVGNGWRGAQGEEELSADYVEHMGLMADGSSKAKLPGISLDNAAYCRIEDNLIEKNWGDGVKCVRATYACTIAHNLITHNNLGSNERFHFFGVLVGVAARQHPEQSDFPSCHNRIIGNDIIGAHFAGVHLLPHTIGNCVQDNRISGCAFMAIENHTHGGNFIEDNGAYLLPNISPAAI